MAKIWHTDGSIVYQQLSAEYLEEALDFVDTQFYPYENICQTIGVPEDPEALKELRDLTRTTAYDGLSLVAVDTVSNKVVGVVFNKIQVRDNPVFENFFKQWKCEKAKAVVEFMAEFDNLCNLYDHCQIDCIFELMYLGTSHEYKGRGIAKKLAEISLEIATKLANGINVSQSIDSRELGLEFRPKVISAIFSSFITQKIGKHLGMQIAAEKDVDKLEFKGLDFSNMAAGGTTKVTLEYKRL